MPALIENPALAKKAAPHVAPADRGRGACQMIPSVVGPSSSATLEKLSSTEQRVFETLLTAQAEFIDHPILHKKNAEKLIEDLVHETFANSKRKARMALDDLPDIDNLDIGTNVLTAAEERALFLKFNYARYRVYKLLEAHAGKRMPLQAIRDLLRWQTKAQHTRSEITQLNVPLVLAMAKRTRMSQVDFSDLVSEGNLALLRSVDKFDASRGFKFSTYACRAILKAFSRVAVKTTQYRGRFPTEFDPALERSAHTEHCREELEADCAYELRDIVLRNRAGLTDVEQTVLNARFCLDRPKDAEPLPNLTLEEVGRLIGVTKERVRQIQKKAMAKLRIVLEERMLV